MQPGIRRKYLRRWEQVIIAEMNGYLGARFFFGTQDAASLVDNWATTEDSPLYPIR